MLPTPSGDNPSSLSPARSHPHRAAAVMLELPLALEPKKRGYLTWDFRKFCFSQFLLIKFLIWAGNPCATASSQARNIRRLGSWCPLDQPWAFLVNHKRSGPATRQPLWGAGCQAATPASKGCQGFPGFERAAAIHSPFPSLLWDQQSQPDRSFLNKTRRSLPLLLLISLNPLRSVGSHRCLLSCPLSKKLQSVRLVHCHRICSQAGQTPCWNRANFSFSLSFSSLPTLTDFVINLGWIYPKSRRKSLDIRKC